jgi:transposase
MVCLVLTNAQWEKIAPYCLGKPGDPGRSGSENRRFIDAVLWSVKTHVPWCDLPAVFGDWNTVFNCFDDCPKAGVWRGFSMRCRMIPTWTMR